MSYAAFEHFETYFEQFGTGYYGSLLHGDSGSLIIATNQWQIDIDASFNKINILLDSIGRIPIVPIGTNVKTGSYHPHLIEWNTVDTIFTKLKSRHSVEYKGALPEWMMSFYSRGESIFQKIQDEEIVLDTDTTNTGIGYPIPITKVGMATFYSNWDSGFYYQSEFPKFYRFKITNVSEGSSSGQAYFKYSNDDGFTWQSTEILTDSGWIAIEGGLEIRWANTGTLFGTQVQLALNDEYKVTCIPTNIKTANSKVHVRTFRRG